jgi:predicted transcriptional regulator
MKPRHARIPETALYVSSSAYKVLGALQHWIKPGSVGEVTDQELGAAVNASERTIQHRLAELEQAGFIQRQRGRGRRFIRVF